MTASHRQPESGIQGRYRVDVDSIAHPSGLRFVVIGSISWERQYMVAPVRREKKFTLCWMALVVLVCCQATLPGRAGEPFEPVEIPDWVYEATRMTFLAGEAADAERAGAQIVQFNMIWPYYPLVRDGGTGAPADQATRLHKLVDDLHARGMKAILGLPPFPPVNMVEAHPDWRIHPDDTGATLKLEPREDNLGTRNFCNNGPWGDYLIDLLVEVVEEYKLDGYSFDGNYHPPICYCPACKESYRQQRGRAIPPAVDLANIEYREYLVWRGEKLEEHYRQMQTRLKSLDPNQVIMTWSTNGGRYGHFLTSPRVMSTRTNLLFDLPMQEWWLDETNFGHSLLAPFGAAYLGATTGHRPNGSEPYLMTRGNPYFTDSFPRHERHLRSLQALTNGSASLESLGWPGGIDAARSVFDEVKAREKWVTRAQPMPWAAMLVSEQTRQFYAWQDIADRFLPHVVGTFRACTEEHLPLTLINDWDLTPETLKKFQVLVLPNAAALSDEQCAAVREYVENGGGLVATCETSLMDELGRPRTDFALADLFGASYRGRPEQTKDRPTLDANFAVTVDENYWRQRVGAATFSLEQHPLVAAAKFDELAPGRRISFKGPQVRVSEPADSATVAMRFTPEGWQHAPLPGVIVRPFGKGKVIYLAAGFDAAMWSYWTPFHRELLSSAIRSAVSAPPPIAVEAPMCVQTTFFEQQTPEGSRLVLHFFNGSDTSAGHGLPAMDVPLREESIAIGGMSLTIDGPAPKSIRVEPRGLEVKTKKNAAAGLLFVELPPLETHYMVTVER